MLSIEESIISGVIGGFISKFISDGLDVSKSTIKKVVENSSNKNQNIQTKIYQVIINTFNQITSNKYENNQDIIYDASEKLLNSFKNNKENNLEAIRTALYIFKTPVDNEKCEKFKTILYQEICKIDDLYREISLLKQDRQMEDIHSVMDGIDDVKQIVTEIKENGLNNRNVQDHKTQQKTKSRTQEYADKWNENMFLNNFNEWDENANLNVKLKDVYMKDYLPHFIWGNNIKIFTNLKTLLFQHIENGGKNKMLLILGQPGIGKSTLITWILANFSHRINDILVYKFASDLKNIDWKNSKVSSGILKELCLEYDDLNGKILIIDGFDEVSIEDNRRRNILDNLYSDWIYDKVIEKFSLIITCRENYIKELEKIKCDYISLQPWDEIQIRDFCNTFQGKTKNSVSDNTIEKLLKNKEILGIPLILYMTLALNISIEKEGSIVDIYDKIFSLEGGIYDRCIDNKKFTDSHRIGETKEYIHQISREIAMWMFENKPEEAYIPQIEYQKVCNKVFLEYEDNQTSKGSKDDFLIGNYFKQIKHCEGVDSVCLYFIHRSIYEYFVAEYIFATLSKSIKMSKENLASVLGNLLKGNTFSIDKEILAFLKYKISNSKINNFFDKINEAFTLMTCNGMTYYTNRHFKNIIRCELNVFANILEILHFWENRDLNLNSSIFQYIKHNTGIPLNLSFINFNGIHSEDNSIDLSNVNLSNANLKGVNLENVNLSNSIFNNACLAFAKLNNANLKYSSLSNTFLMGAEIINANLKGANLSDSNLLGVKMINTNLEGANLSNTQLNMAKLINSDLKRVNLDNANLSRVDLCGTDLSTTDLTYTTLTNAVIDEEQLKMITNINALKKIGIRISKSVIISYKEYAKKEV